MSEPYTPGDARRNVVVVYVAAEGNTVGPASGPNLSVFIDETVPCSENVPGTDKRRATKGRAIVGKVENSNVGVVEHVESSVDERLLCESVFSRCTATARDERPYATVQYPPPHYPP